MEAGKQGWGAGMNWSGVEGLQGVRGNTQETRSVRLEKGKQKGKVG